MKKTEPPKPTELHKIPSKEKVQLDDKKEEKRERKLTLKVKTQSSLSN
jgi:hypothetical protein